MAATWWNTNYKYRKKITVTNNETSQLASGFCIVRASIDTATLYSNSKVLLSGDDLRIVRWNGATNTEIDRHIRRGMNSSDTEIAFATQAAINGSSSDDGYYIYYGYSSASAPSITYTNIYEEWKKGDTTDGWSTQTGSNLSSSGGILTVGTGTNVTYTSSKNSQGWIYDVKVKVGTVTGTYGYYWGLQDSYDYCGYDCCNSEYTNGVKDILCFSSMLDNSLSTTDYYAHIGEGAIGGIGYDSSSGFTRPTDYVIGTFQWADNNNKVLMDSVSKKENTTYSVGIGNYMLVTLANMGSNGDLNFDWLAVREYTANAPTALFGDEEGESKPVCWGQDTDVDELNIRDFSGNWTGTGAVSGSSDSEKLLICVDEYMESETWQLGAGNASITLNKYGSGSGSPPIQYKTGADASACEADSWHNYSTSFTSLGYVKIRLNGS